MTKAGLERFVSVLNQHCRCDPKAVRAVFEYCHKINDDLESTDVIARDTGTSIEISALGVFNSCQSSKWVIGMDDDESDPEPFRVVRRA